MADIKFDMSSSDHICCHNILCDMSGSFLSRQCFCKILAISGSIIGTYIDIHWFESLAHQLYPYALNYIKLDIDGCDYNSFQLAPGGLTERFYPTSALKD
ncbi:unnamed protein product, partial [Trichobilharzia regenti]